MAKIVKTLKFPGSTDDYQINAVAFNGMTNIDNDSLKATGGIIALKQEYIDYLDNQLYQSPAISTFNIVGSDVEVGKTVTVSSFTHAETNTKNINGKLTLTCNKDSSVQLSVDPSSSTSTVTFSKSYTFTDAATLTYTLSGVNTKGVAFSKTDSVKGYYPSFIGASTSASISDTSGLTKVASASLAGTRSVTVTNHYVYFVTTSTISSIKSGGFDVSYSKLSNITLSINGVSKSYNVYRTNQTITSTLSYVIA